MFGKYNAINVVAAYAVGQHFGIPKEKIAKKIADYVPDANRSEVVRFKNCIVIKDAYNANPSSMELALKSFSESYKDGHVVLGDMKELGETSLEAHAQIIALTASLPFEKVYLVGPFFQQAFSMMNVQEKNFVLSPDIETLQSTWNWETCNGKAILLKGSRSMHLESLLN